MVRFSILVQVEDPVFDLSVVTLDPLDMTIAEFDV